MIWQCPQCSTWIAAWVAEHRCATTKAARTRKPVRTAEPAPAVAAYFGPPKADEQRPLSDEELADLVRGINEGALAANQTHFDPADEFRTDTFGSEGRG